MGLFGNIVNKLQQSANNGRNSTLLHLVFQENQNFASLALKTFQRCAAERGVEFNEQLMSAARREVSNDPDLTMGRFLDDYSNK